MVTNGGMFLKLLQPPYQNKSYADRFIVFDRVFTEPDQVINSSRFKTALSDTGVSGPYLWQNNIFQLIPLSKSKINEIDVDLSKQAIVHPANAITNGIPSGKQNAITINNLPLIEYIEIHDLAINPLDIDFVQFELSLNNWKPGPHYAVAAWNTIDPIQEKHGIATVVYSGAKSQLITVPLSHYWRWYASTKINSLILILPSEQQATISNIKFLKADSIAPQISFKADEYQPLGIFHLDDGKATLFVDSTKIKGSEKCIIQRSKPNYFFDSFTGDKQEYAVANSQYISAAQGSLVITNKDLETSGYYQFRCRALSHDGKPLGSWSEALTLYR